MRKVIFFVVILFISCSDSLVEPEFVREPADQDIKLLYKYWFNDEVDTFNETLTKDLVIDGVITIDYWFQTSDQTKIIEMVEEVNFWSLRDTLDQNPMDSVYVVIDPDPGIQSLKIEYEGKSETVFWYLQNDYEAENARLEKLTDLIWEIISSDLEYKNLPPRNGSYF